MEQKPQNIRCCDCKWFTVLNAMPLCESARPWWAERAEARFGLTHIDALDRHDCDMYDAMRDRELEGE